MTPKNYDNDVRTGNFPATGIRENSSFNKLLQTTRMSDFHSNDLQVAHQLKLNI
jgi:hypothetical protein